MMDYESYFMPAPIQVKAYLVVNSYEFCLKYRLVCLL